MLEIFALIVFILAPIIWWNSLDDDKKKMLLVGGGIFIITATIIYMIVRFWRIIVAFIIIASALTALLAGLYAYLKHYNQPQQVEKRRQKKIELKAEEERRRVERVRFEAEQRRMAENARQDAEKRWLEDQRRANKEKEDLQNRLIPKTVTARTPDRADDILKAGDEGEALLANTFLSHGNFTGCFWWSSKRVKEGIGDKGPNEIDIIILSHNYIYSLEAKNYAGRLIKNYNKNDIKHPWIRLKSKRDQAGKIVNDSTEIELVENLDASLEIKVLKLISYLHKRNIKIQKSLFKRKVIFTNKNFVLDDSVNDERLICLDKLKPYLDSDGNIPDQSSLFVSSLIRYILDEESAARIQFPDSGFNSLAANLDLVRSINFLPSWDHLVFFGGKKIRGDVFLDCQIFNNQDDLKILIEDCDIKFHCERNPERIKKDWDSGKNQRAEIVTSNARQSIIKELNYHHPYIRFHAVGDKKPETISVYEIEKVELRGFLPRCRFE